MRTLVLGGTAWLGRAVAGAALELGHDVTCLARGSAPFPAGVRAVAHDRREPWPALGGFDLVVDVARDPALVRPGLDAARYVLVGSGSAYAPPYLAGADETAPLLERGGAGPFDYGYAKVRCERAVAAAYPVHLLARAGLIGGPGDETGRSTYWPWRRTRPGPALVPDTLDQPFSLVDVRDLARWLLITDATGPVDAVGPVHPLREATGEDVVTAPGGWLRLQGVETWAGPRSLPLWIDDPDWVGFAARSGARARATGLVCRPLAETFADALEWLGDRTPASGLTDDEQAALLSALPSGPAPAG